MKGRDIYLRVLKFVKPYWPRLLVAMVCMAVVSAITAAFALLTKNVLDDIFINKDRLMLTILPLAIMGLGVVKGGFTFVQGYLMNYVGQRVVANIRERLYSHLQTPSLSFFDKTPTGVLMARITNDVNSIQGAVSNAVTGMVKDVFTAIGLIGVVFYRDWQLALLAILVFPLAIYPFIQFSRKLRKISKRTLETMAYISTFLQETIFGHRVRLGVPRTLAGLVEPVSGPEWSVACGLIRLHHNRRNQVLTSRTNRSSIMAWLRNALGEFFELGGGHDRV